jgi:hypothetical protein
MRVLRINLYSVIDFVFYLFGKLAYVMNLHLRYDLYLPQAGDAIVLLQG